MNYRFREFAQLAVLLLCGAPAVLGHEYWIEPSTYRPKARSVVTISSHLGERFAGEPVIFDADRCEKFETVGPAGATPIVGRSGGPIAYGRVGEAGAYILGFRSKRTLHEMEAAAFERYLKEEGLGSIVEERKKLGETARPGREYFSRCAKSIVTVGPAGEGFDRVIGHTLELVPETNPGAIGAGGEVDGAFKVRALYAGSGLAGATLVAVAREKPTEQIKVTTDAEGRAELKLPRSGVYLLTTIHMVRVEDDPQADWESFWASLTFEAAVSEAAAKEAVRPRRGKDE